MERSFAATNLGAAEIDSAYALIQALFPNLTLEAWRVYAHPLAEDGASPRCGIIGIRNETGYLGGLFVYRVEADLEHGRAFLVEPIAALDFLDAKAAMRAMMEAVRSRAHQFDCRIARIRVGREQPSLAAYLRGSGLQVEAQLLCGPVGEPSQQN
jgi:hypothetical protein